MNWLVCDGLGITVLRFGSLAVLGRLLGVLPFVRHRGCFAIKYLTGIGVN